MNPEVTVIIPAYNAAGTIGRAIASLKSQTIPVEIVVVDDGSTDGSSESLDSYLQLQLDTTTIRIIHQQNSGGYAARRRGLQEVKTPYFGFMDADDWVEPTMYEKMLAAAKAHDLDVVQCDVYGAADRGLRVVEDLKSEVFDPILIKGTVASFVWKYYGSAGKILAVFTYNVLCYMFQKSFHCSTSSIVFLNTYQRYPFTLVLPISFRRWMYSLTWS